MKSFGEILDELDEPPRLPSDRSSKDPSADPPRELSCPLETGALRDSLEDFDAPPDLLLDKPANGPSDETPELLLDEHFDALSDEHPGVSPNEPSDTSPDKSPVVSVVGLPAPLTDSSDEAPGEPPNILADESFVLFSINAFGKAPSIPMAKASGPAFGETSATPGGVPVTASPEVSLHFLVHGAPKGWPEATAGLTSSLLGESGLVDAVGRINR